MTKWALIHDDVVTQIVTKDPSKLFHENVASDWQKVPSNVKEGAKLIEGEFVNPEPVKIEPVVVYSALSKTEFFKHIRNVSEKSLAEYSNLYSANEMMMFRDSFLRDTYNPKDVDFEDVIESFVIGKILTEKQAKDILKTWPKVTV